MLLSLPSHETSNSSFLCRSQVSVDGATLLIMSNSMTQSYKMLII